MSKQAVINDRGQEEDEGPACLDTLLMGRNSLADELLEPSTDAGRQPRLTDVRAVVFGRR